MKIKIRDSKELMDSINELKKKIMDAEVDLTKPGIASIANALLEKKSDINAAKGFADLRDIMKDVVKEFDTPKAREILLKIDELDRLYQRAPQDKRNDYWCWEKLLKYCYNILLKASGNPSPDVKQDSVEDAKEVKDDMNDLSNLARLLGEAHDKIMEALDLAEGLESSEEISSELVYRLEDLEAAASELDFTGEADPVEVLLENYSGDADLDSWEIDEEDW